MQIAAGFPTDGGIDGELVAAGVDRDFVVAVSLGDLGVDFELTVEFSQVADVVDSLLEFTDEAGSQRGKFHTAATQFTDDVEVM